MSLRVLIWMNCRLESELGGWGRSGVIALAGDLRCRSAAVTEFSEEQLHKMVRVRRTNVNLGT